MRSFTFHGEQMRIITHYGHIGAVDTHGNVMATTIVSGSGPPSMLAVTTIRYLGMEITLSTYDATSNANPRWFHHYQFSDGSELFVPFGDHLPAYANELQAEEATLFQYFIDFFANYVPAWRYAFWGAVSLPIAGILLWFGISEVYYDYWKARPRQGI